MMIVLQWRPIGATPLHLPPLIPFLTRCRFMESGIANQKELAAEVVARLAAQHRKVALVSST
jgi:hypothetical protein